MPNYSNQLRINLTNLDKITHKENNGNRSKKVVTIGYLLIV